MCVHGGKFAGVNSLGFPDFFFRFSWWFGVHNCCHVRMKGGGIFLTLLLLIAGSTRTITRKCIVGTTPARNHFQTGLLDDASFRAFLRTAFELFCLNIFDFSSLALTRSITITIFFSFHFFPLSGFPSSSLIYAVFILFLSFTFSHDWIALTLSLTDFNPKKV